MSQTKASQGLFGQLQGSLGSSIELLRIRLALLGTELELEKHRVSIGLLWGAAALLTLTVAVVLFCGFVILLLWEGYRLAAVGGLTIGFFAIGLLLLRYARRMLLADSHLFSVSMAELKRDRDALTNTPPHAS